MRAQCDSLRRRRESAKGVASSRKIHLRLVFTSFLTVKALCEPTALETQTSSAPTSVVSVSRRGSAVHESRWPRSRARRLPSALLPSNSSKPRPPPPPHKRWHKPVVSVIIPSPTRTAVQLHRLHLLRFPLVDVCPERVTPNSVNGLP